MPNPSLTPLLLLSLAAGCGAGAADARSAPPRELVVTAADFYFRAARTIPAGLTRVRLENAGPQFHHIQLVRLADGHTARELLERLAARDFALPWATYVGGPDSPMPGREAEVTLNLAPGEYAIICLISGADHVPHVAKGMALALTVTPSPGGNEREPRADARMVLRDYSFELTTALSAGRRTIRVENAGAQPHHVALVRLGRGRTPADAREWAKRMEGAPPDEPVGGTTAIAPGGVNFVTVDLTPGDYALICFLPDTRDGRSHADHGMVSRLRVL